VRTSDKALVPSARIGVIPWTTPANMPALHAFTIYDSSTVLPGTQTTTTIMTDRRNVAGCKAH
jgi:hypothetical protein